MTDCAILAIASTQQTAVLGLVKDVLDEQASSVPWTIVNKYYTAEVSFLVYPLSSWAALQDELLAPALLFVWNRGEPYRDQIRQLSQRRSQHEFEVALAVRLPSSDFVSPVMFEDDQDIDAYLSSEGFEFVDVPDTEPSSPNHTGIPGILRIIDALSTIMWPSMNRQTSKRLTTAGFIRTVQMNPGISSDDYHDLVRLVGDRASGQDGDCMRREIEELERWLNEDTPHSSADARSADGDDEAVLWSTAVTPGTLSPSLSSFLEHSRRATPQLGFDDDFTSLVSASTATFAGIPPNPSDSSSSSPTFPSTHLTSFDSTFSFNLASSGHSTPIFDDHAIFDVTHSAAGESYKSLGSMSDFGDMEKESVNLTRLSNDGDQEAEGTPSRMEIAETSHKNFGAMPLLFSPMQERTEGDPQALDESQSYLCGDFDVEMTDANLERFDLQSVLGALQGLKEEIAGMPDKERRKAAARVALGVAYGLDSNLRSAANEEFV